VEKPKPEKPIDVKKSQKSALNRLKELDAFAKLEKVAAEHKAAEAKAAADAKAAAAQAKAAALIAGHKVTAGNSLTGIPRLEYDRYGAELKARVLGNWAVPAWLSEAGLSARVRVWLDDAGRVTKKQISKSSGDDVFDAAALEAVTKSDPFPPPPDNLRGVLAAEGFTLGLPK
jgi:colicin import membrane protein